MSFERALKFVLKQEGGFVDHPSDPGGPTNFGITQRVYDEFRKRSVRFIEPQEVESIYRRSYWTPARCDSLPTRLALVHFDSAVNCGVKQAAKFLQRAAGVRDDGVIGPVTLQSAKSQDENGLIDRYILERRKFYHSLSVTKPELAVFLKGWLKRLDELANEVTE